MAPLHYWNLYQVLLFEKKEPRAHDDSGLGKIPSPTCNHHPILQQNFLQPCCWN
ncbi:hypothetical protein BDV19DRAFT_361279 [Aspergillus venezuelensis]